jgi:hypothetical protein
MILSGQFAGEEDVQRFRAEAEAAANLDHPGIVPIYEVGEYEGQQYFSMGYIEGGSLADKIKDGPLPPKVAAEYVKKIAEAISFAHENGVIHRDLKPANVLLDRNGEPKVTDFGLAKKVEGDSGLTRTGAVMGTPSYMPPEQAGGKTDEVGPRADVYSLGAILYCLLTGRPPFHSANTVDILLQVLEKEPVSPQALNADVSKDLNTVCLKCLEKDAHSRYGIARELADELDRFLKNEPIRARPISRPARMWRWCKRKTTLAGLCAVAGILFLLLSIGGPIAAIDQANNARQQFILRAKADAQSQRADEEAATARSNLVVAEINGYGSDMLLAQQDWEDANLAHLRELLDRYRDRSELKGFEWRYWDRLTNSDLFTLKERDLRPRSVTFSPDGTRLVSAWGSIGKPGEVKVYDAGTGKELLTLVGHKRSVHSVAFNPNGTRLASASGNSVKVWDAATGEELLTLPVDNCNCATFSPDGTRIASAHGTFGQQREGEVKLWNATTGQEMLTIKGHSSLVSSVAFSPDGTRLASVSQDGTVKVWDAIKDQETLTFKAYVSWVLSVAFSPDGKRLASGSFDRTVKVWDPATGRETLTLKGHTSTVTSVAFSRDGTRIASGSGTLGKSGEVTVWDTRTGRKTLTDKGHIGFVMSVAFSPDGTLLASTGEDGTVKVWDARPFVEQSLARPDVPTQRPELPSNHSSVCELAQRLSW